MTIANSNSNVHSYTGRKDDRDDLTTSESQDVTCQVKAETLERDHEAKAHDREFDNPLYDEPKDALADVDNSE